MPTGNRFSQRKNFLAAKYPMFLSAFVILLPNVMKRSRKIYSSEFINFISLNLQFILIFSQQDFGNKEKSLAPIY